MTGNIEADGSIYTEIANTGQIYDNRTIQIIIGDLDRWCEILGQRPLGELESGPEAGETADLPDGWLKAMQLLSRDSRVELADRRRAYATWLVTRPAHKPAQRLAARERYVPLQATLPETDPLRQQFTGWYPQPEGPPQARQLADVTEAVQEHAAFVLLGAPGSGKTTVLYRLQYQAARAFLQGHSQRLPLLVTLAGYRWEQQEPLSFLDQQWQAHVADDFMELVRAGQIMLLLDGLNEMRRLASYRDHQQRVNDWEHLLQEYFASGEGESRAVVASRKADYEQTLDLPRVEIDPLDEAQIDRFLELYLGAEEAGKALAAIHRLELLELARVPYSLAVLTDLYDPDRGDLPSNQGRLFAVYADQLLLAEKKQTELPLEAARLALNQLGYHMQAAGESTALPGDQLEALLPTAVQLPGRRPPVDTPPPAVFDLACRANLISLDPGSGPRPLYQFTHHLLQEQFAAADLLRRWQSGEDVAELWRTPRLQADMPPAEVGAWDPLPPPPPTGWEQTTLMAAGLPEQADRFVQAVLAVHPALAGRCLSEGAAVVTAETWAAVQQALLAGLADPAWHRRSRLEAGRVLGRIGDPRFVPVTVNGTALILPHLVEVGGGETVIGSQEEEAFDDEQPVHAIEIAPFYLGRYPVTNAEYRCFWEAGGYDTERYWTPTGWQWRQGELEESGPIQEWLDIRQNLLKNPELPAKRFAEGRITPEERDTWEAVIKMTEEELRQELSKHFAPQPHQQPYYWEDPAYNGANQPLVGVTWYEAMAYCAWLNEQIAGDESGHLGLEPEEMWTRLRALIREGRWAVRLPAEVEWEWAAGGAEHHRYPWGEQFEPDRANTLDGRVLGTSPVGAYPGGAAACGALDLAGNVWEWTGSRYWEYPYRWEEGREEPLAAGRRVLRGGSWVNGHSRACPAATTPILTSSTSTGFGWWLPPSFRSDF